MKKGFTLIELSVVIAIIGILASAIAVSLNFSRKKANAAAMQAAFKNLQNGIIVCCTNANVSLFPTSVGADICPGSPVGVLIPSGTELKSEGSPTSYFNAGGCQVADPSYTITFNGPGNCTGATVTQTKITLTGTSCP